MKKMLLLGGLLLAALVSGVSQQMISGTVTDKEGIPLIGANVREKGGTSGDITDANGNASFDIAPRHALPFVFTDLMHLPDSAFHSLMLLLNEKVINNSSL